MKIAFNIFNKKIEMKISDKEKPAFDHINDSGTDSGQVCLKQCPECFHTCNICHGFWGQP